MGGSAGYDLLATYNTVFVSDGKLDTLISDVSTVDANVDSILADTSVMQPIVSANLDATVSSRLPTTGYTAPPTVDAVAHEVWETNYTTHGGANSYGLLVESIKTETASIQADTDSIEAKVDTIYFTVDRIEIDTTSIESKVDIIDTNVDDIETDTSVIQPLVSTNLDATVSSRLATSGYTTPPTVLAIADQVWDESLVAHLGLNTTGEAIYLTKGTVITNLDDKISNVDDNVRTNLNIELGRIDVTVSSRLPTTGYTAPDNATIGNIYDDTQQLLLDVAAIPSAPAIADIVDAVWDEAYADHSGIGHIGSFGSLLEDEIHAGITQLNLDISDVADDVDQVLLDVAAVPTAAENADAVWDESIIDHTDPNTFGEKCGSIVALPPLQDIADAVWETIIPVTPGVGSYGEKLDSLTTPPSEANIAEAVWEFVVPVVPSVDSFGELIKTNLDDKISDVDENVRLNLDSELVLIATNLDEMISSRLASADYTVPLDTAGTAGAVWNAATASYGIAGSYGKLIEDNLDMKLTDIPTAAENADAIWDEAKTAHSIADSFGLLIKTNIDDKITNVDDNVRTNLTTELGLINTNLDEKISDVRTDISSLNDFDPATDTVTLAAKRHEGAVIPEVEVAIVT